MTTTDLRTKSSLLVKTLLAGGEVTLIHRSRVIGEIRSSSKGRKIFEPEQFLKVASKLNLPITSYTERDGIYREAMTRKYGKGIPGR